MKTSTLSLSNHRIEGNLFRTTTPSNKLKNTLLILGLVSLTVAGAGAQVVTFTISGLAGTTSTVNGTAATGVSGTPVLGRTGLTANSGSNVYASTNNLITQNTPDFSNKYIGFTVTPNASNVLFAKSLTFGVSGSNTTSNQYGVGYSTDGFTTYNSTTGSVTGTATNKTYDFTDLITNDTLSVRIQNFGTSAISGTVATTGSFRLTAGTNGVQLTGSTVTAASGSIALTSATEIRNSGALTLGGDISGSFGVTKTGGGTLTLSGSNTYTGATDVTTGKLVVTNTIGSSAVTVSGSGAILATDTAATIGSTVAINSGAILAVGDAANVSTATATVTGATTFNDGSIFSWDIDAAGTSYDKLITSSLVDGDNAGGSTFRIVASDALVAAGFWNTSKTWSDIFSTDGTTAIANWGAVFGNTVSVVNSSFNAITPNPSFGSFSLSGSTLTWTAVPEPSSALAGLLLTAGLLRRNRRAA